MASQISQENDDSEGQMHLDNWCTEGQSLIWKLSCRMLGSSGSHPTASQTSQENEDSEGQILSGNLCMEGQSWFWK